MSEDTFRLDYQCSGCGTHYVAGDGMDGDVTGFNCATSACTGRMERVACDPYHAICEGLRESAVTGRAKELAEELCARRAATSSVARGHRRSPHQNVLLGLPTNKEDRKATPITRGLLDYFPAACAEVARVSLVANEQHNPGEEMHWARGKSSDHADCIARHLIERGTIDLEDGLRHTAKAAWRALALLQEELEQEAGFDPGQG